MLIYSLRTKNQLTVICTARGIRRCISIRCQKECVESKLSGQSDLYISYLAKFRYQKVSEYDQEIPQSHTTDQPTASEEEPQNIYSNIIKSL